MEEKVTALGGVSNDAKLDIELQTPYIIEVEIEGTSPILFHRWSCDSIEEKSKAAKGSKAKKTDDTESYLYRTDAGEVAIPSEYFRQAIIHAAKFKQDPRSPRKSAMDLFKAGIATLGELCTLGAKEPDYYDRRRVVVQRNGITRVRPAMAAGWKCKTSFQILLPEYISPSLVNDVLQMSGKVVGIADFRPSFGRFLVTRFSVVKLK